MADTEDQTVVGSTCMKYRRQGGGVLLINNCDAEMVFAVKQKASSAGDNKPMTVNVSVGSRQTIHHPTGGSDNVLGVSIGSK